MVRVLNGLRTVLPGLICGSILISASAASAADAAQGKQVFAQQCAMCHTTTKGGSTLVGPNLFGVVGRHAGIVAGFAYSSAIKGSGFTWTDATLSTFLQAPGKTLPGVRMPFAGLKNPTQLDNVVAYLNTLR
jgi:cytochrome c